MDIHSKKEGNVAVITLSGRLDAQTTPQYEARSRELIEAGELVHVVNLEQLDYVSSAGLRAFLVTAKQLKAKKGQIRFANARGVVREVFDLSGFGAIFAMDDSVVLSIDALSGQS